MTLGQLRDYLKIFISNDALIKELDYFIKLRNDCVHRLLDDNMSALDIEVSKNFNRYYRLSFWLIRRQTKLYKSAARSSQRKIKTLITAIKQKPSR